uniref:Uncharacterized protein n=1 Tax=Ditylenchus dipsaci TaxID=166011 RepID=A0A915EMD3_9BILA
MEACDEANKRYQCCCSNFHVEAFVKPLVCVLRALAIAHKYISWCLHHCRPRNTAKFDWATFFDFLHSYASLPIHITWILVCACIIHAQRSQSPKLYWPFLISNGIGIVLTIIYVIILVILLILPPSILKIQWYLKYIGIDVTIANPDEVFCIASAILIFEFAICGAINMWWQMVVYRAYEYMKLTHLSMNAQAKDYGSITV